MPRHRTSRLVLVFTALLLLVAVPAFLAPWYGWGQTPGDTVQV